MAKLIGKQPFHALKVDAVRHDCGDKAGFVIANVALALERDDLGPESPGVPGDPLGAALALETPAAAARLSAFRSCSRISPSSIARATTRASSAALSSLQALDGPRAREPPLDAGNQHFEVEGFQDDVVGAGRIGGDCDRPGASGR